MFSRRLYVLVLALVLPVIAACGVSPTGNDPDDPPPPAPFDSTSLEGWPWI